MAKTGCDVMDKLVGSYQGLTLVYGVASAGKTTLAKIAAIELSKEGKVIFLDTENGFNASRIKQLTSEFKNVISKVIVINAKNFYHQHKAIMDIWSIKGVSLVVVDTIGAHYRVYVKKDYKKANLILRKQVNVLKELSRKIPVIMATQVYSDIKTGMLKPIGGKIVTGSSDMVIRLEKSPRRVVIEKPFVKDALFEICEKGIFSI